MGAIKKEDVLNLEAIFNCSTNKKVQKEFSVIFQEEIAQAQERAIIRSALLFRNKLSKRQQELVIKRAEELSLCTA